MSAFSARLAASFARECDRLRGARWDWAMISWVPLLALWLVWAIFSAGIPLRLPVGLVDADHSALSRQLGRFLAATPGLEIRHQPASPAEADALLRRGEIYAVIEIPREFERTVKQGRAAQVTLLHNAEFGSHSGMLQRDVRTAVGTLAAGVEIATRIKRGEAPLAARAGMEPIRANMVTLFNAALDYERFLALALLPAMLHIFAMTAGAWTVGRELRERSIAEWLGVAPAPGGVLAALLGKCLPAFVSLSTVGCGMLLWITHGRGWHPEGSLLWVQFALCMLIALSLAMGVAACAFSRSLRIALSATGFITAPAFAFSGIGFPRLAMPTGAQWWADVLPLTHYLDLQVAQLVMAAPLRQSLAAPLLMLAAAALLGALSALSLRATAERPETWGGR